MKLIDLAELEDGSSLEADICIVGSGPAGATIAKELSESRVRVIILEGGGLQQTPADQALYDFENVGAIRNKPANHHARSRSVGGTSNLWNGRCTTFDDIDFKSRAWLPHSGWPIDTSDIRSFLDRSRKHLGIGPNVYDERLWKELGVSASARLDPVVLKSQFWQYSRGGSFGYEPVRFSKRLSELQAPNIKLLAHANVTLLNTTEDGTQVASLDVRTLQGKRAKVKAANFVLACGGLENARLLLASNHQTPNGIGNFYDLVGRYLMDHPGCKLGSIDQKHSIAIQRRFGRYLLDHDAGRNSYAFGLKLSPEIQRKEHLLNCAAFLEASPSPHDSCSALKRLIWPDRKRGPSRGAADAAAVIGDLPWLLGNVYRRIAWQQALIHRNADLWLYSMVEQTPDPLSRVTLAEKTDALGVPVLKIDWRVGELERRSVTWLRDLVASELRHAGLEGSFHSNQLLDAPNWRSQFIDHNHPSGTTRMSNSPTRGVVDQNCKVHGIKNLYVAGSSVFPTAGHANPTLLIVALAIRLADWLKQNDHSTTLLSQGTLRFELNSIDS